MDIGMLWFDNDTTRTFEIRLHDAITYYQNKYGKLPNLCFVNPITGKDGTYGAVEVRHSSSVLPNHFWLGVHSQPVSKADWKTRRRDDWRMEMDREERTP